MDKIKKGVRLDHISKIYQDPKTGKDFYAVKDTSLTIEPGSFVTLLGPSGCGKTTTLRIIGGFLTPTSGTVTFDGKTINDVPPYKRQINTVFQRYALFPHLDVYDNVAFGLKINKVPKAEIDQRVREMLEIVSLKGYENRRIDALSGGQQQRVGIARAFVARPDVVFADEPTGNLDSKTTIEVMDMIKSFARKYNQTIVLVTHDPELAQYADRIVTLVDGRIVSDTKGEHNEQENK